VSIHLKDRHVDGMLIMMMMMLKHVMGMGCLQGCK
jgi:hypothetical protein